MAGRKLQNPAAAIWPDSRASSLLPGRLNRSFLPDTNYVALPRDNFTVFPRDNFTVLPRDNFTVLPRDNFTVPETMAFYPWTLAEQCC